MSSVEQLAQSIGHAISVSRRARKIKQADLAAQVNIGMNTMVSIEKGVTTVQLGYYLQVLIALGMDECLKQITSLTADSEAIQSMASSLPKRVIVNRAARKSPTEHYED